MRIDFALAVVAIWFTTSCSGTASQGQSSRAPRPVYPPTSTFSIVARDAENGDIGVAVQSRFFGVGSVVPWVSRESGAIATQSWANTAYGPEGLALLRDGTSAGEVVRSLTEADPGRHRRQLGIVDRSGSPATYTGSGCLPWAGGRTGEGYAVQGNILVGQETVDAMARAFEESAGEELAERLLRALEAGQRAGGDVRGRQSAAIRVVREGAGYGGNDRYVWLDVEDHPAPIAELRRLLDRRLGRDALSRARRAAQRGNLETARLEFSAAERTRPDDPWLPLERARLEAARGDHAAAATSLLRAVAIQPDYDNVHYQAARLYLEIDRTTEALRHLRRLFELNSAYRSRVLWEIVEGGGPFRRHREAIEASGLLGTPASRGGEGR